MSGWKSKESQSRAPAANKKANANTENENKSKKLDENKTGNKHVRKVIEHQRSRPRSKNIQANFRKEQPAPVQGLRKSSSSSTSFVVLGLLLLFALTGIVAKIIQSLMVKPVSPGALLKPGTYKTKCGVFGYVSLVLAPGWKETA